MTIRSLGLLGDARSGIPQFVAGLARTGHARTGTAIESGAIAGLDLVSGRVAVIGTAAALVPSLSVGANIMLRNEVTRWGFIRADKTRERALHVLDALDCDLDPDAPASEANARDALMIELARASAAAPSVVVVDDIRQRFREPHDRAWAMAQLVRVADMFKGRGIQFIATAHRVDDLVELGCDAVVVYEGVVQVVVPWAELSHDPARVVPAALGRESVAGLGRDTANPRTGSVLAIAPHGSASGGAVAGGGASGEPALHQPAPVHGRAEPPLAEFIGWRVRDPLNPRIVVVHDVELILGRGQIVGLAGLRGSGREAFALSVFGRSYGREVEGITFIEGEETDTSSVQAAIDAGLFFSPGNEEQYGARMLGGITIPTSRARLAQLIKAGMANPDSAPIDPSHRGEAWASKLGKRASGEGTAIGYLEAMRESSAKVIILENPSEGLGPSDRERLYAAVASVAASGRGVLWLGEDTAELSAHCDRIDAFVDGKVVDRVVITHADPGARLRAALRVMSALLLPRN